MNWRRCEALGLPEERTGYDTGEQVGNCHEVVARYAFTNQQPIEQQPYDGND